MKAIERINAFLKPFFALVKLIVDHWRLVLTLLSLVGVGVGYTSYRSAQEIEQKQEVQKQETKIIERVIIKQECKDCDHLRGRIERLERYHP